MNYRNGYIDELGIHPVTGAPVRMEGEHPADLMRRVIADMKAHTKLDDQRPTIPRGCELDDFAPLAALARWPFRVAR